MTAKSILMQPHESRGRLYVMGKSSPFYPKYIPMGMAIKKPFKNPIIQYYFICEKMLIINILYMAKPYQIFDISTKFLQKVCTPIEFPLSNQVLDNINYLKKCFRASIAKEITLGLSAPQVGINQRFFIIPRNFNYTRYNSPRVSQAIVRNYQIFINPKIIEKSEQSEQAVQNCLSVPSPYLVRRSKLIKVQYFKPNGNQQIKEFKGILAKVIQHQTDHLDGITIDQIGQIYESSPKDEKE